MVSRRTMSRVNTALPRMVGGLPSAPSRMPMIRQRSGAFP